MLENYEKSPNRHIGISIVSIQIFISVAVGIHFNWAKNTVVHTLIAIIVNLLAFCLNNINAKINSNYSQKMNQVHYSLSERFQITENIKSAKMFNKIVWSIGFFNVVVNICLIADNYDIPPTWKNIASVACDFSILLYGFIVPIVYFNQTKSWKRRVREILKRRCEPKVSPERNDFANEITSHAPRGEAHKYFEMLKEQWG
ncbi:Protein CBG01326 [Caenorhabditis briggsae]|uniref:Protein CBG01326 n=2 Tax=Caenorhabditis briggsae TaxID=6238 RepID=A8WQ54_CAEBR|nr:Protein CBG01326 [Caenorhabditis briggsae]CAP22612.1 Protein CBG01326 [Caenorhabditis briggsae]